MTPADKQQISACEPVSAGKPGQMKAVWHVKILTGKGTQALLEMQNQAIINLLNWARDHQNTTVKIMPPVREIQEDDSRETMEKAA